MFSATSTEEHEDATNVTYKPFGVPFHREKKEVVDRESDAVAVAISAHGAANPLRSGSAVHAALVLSCRADFQETLAKPQPRAVPCRATALPCRHGPPAGPSVSASRRPG